MERRKFVAATILGSMSVNSPTLSFGSTSETKEPARAFYIPPTTPLTPGPGNADIRTIIHSQQTDRQFSNVEVALAPKQMGPAPHLHNELDELMYVLEGTATVLIGEQIYEVKAGGWNFRPRGIVHSFWNASDKPLRFVDCFFNQNFEDYLEDLFHKIIPDMIKKNLTPESPEIAKRIEALDNKFGVVWFHDKRQPIVEKYGLNG
jgi:quercetin dioxygenase-like cupin family protein